MVGSPGAGLGLADADGDGEGLGDGVGFGLFRSSRVWMHSSAPAASCPAVARPASRLLPGIAASTCCW